MEKLMVLKKDGTIKEFDEKKIKTNIEKATSGSLSLFEKASIELSVIENIKKVGRNIITSEEIDRIVIKVLSKTNKEIFKAYKKVSKERAKARSRNSDLMKSIGELGIMTDRDNANVGSNFSAKLLRIASESNKRFNLNEIEDSISEAHENGDIYIHDLDSYNLTINCLHIPTLETLQSGFNTGYGTINPPKRIESAAALSCILLQASQNDMFGGQSHPDFDNDLGAFVNSTREQIKAELIEDIKNLGLIINPKDESFNLQVEKRLNEKIHQAMQSIVYNLNSMHSRAGSQVPFSSVNIGIPQSDDAALVCKIFLEEYEKGLGKGEQPIFPNIIFRVKEGVNREKEDPYYYLYEVACRVAAKRMNPTFMNLDADFNKEYYDKGYIPATMGCVDGQEIITYKIGDLLYVESFQRMWNRLSKTNEIKEYNKGSSYIPVGNVSVYDTKKGFVKVKNIIKNEDKGDWIRINFTNGRTLLATSDHPLPIINKGRTYIKDVKIGDKININPSQYAEENYIEDKEVSWLLGLILCDGTYDSSLVVSLAIDSENDIEKKYIEIAQKYFGYKIETIERHRGNRGNYKDIIARGKTVETRRYLEKYYGGLQKINRHIPNIIFNSNIESRKSFLAGMIDADGYINKTTHGGSVVQLGSTNKELALQTMALAQSVGYYAKVYLNKYTKTDSNKIRYRVEFIPDADFIKNYIVSSKKQANFIGRKENINIHNTAEVSKIETMGYLNNPSYDVETESDHFEVSGIYSHNCRTYLMKNVNGEQGCKGRGNIAPTTINLPRIGLQAKGDINKFFEIFESKIESAKNLLIARYDTLKGLKVRDLPFVAGQFLMKGSENLSQEDSIEPILKQGTWGIGFIGLAETLVALTSKHHGESEEARELGLKIVTFLREKCDYYTDTLKLNFSAYATPAEGLSGKFIIQDKLLFGEIKGVTDKDYYTNSYHIPVGYAISIKEKIDIEAPYHKLCNGGHISYIEVDDKPNGELVMDILNYAYKNTNISYMGINFHMRYCRDCGKELYNHENKCPKCKSTNIQGISRVTGYLSLDERFGSGKLAERKDRITQDGHHNYN